MSHTPKTEIGRLARAYREHEHEPDFLDDATDEDGDLLLTVRGEIANDMKALLRTEWFAPSTYKLWQDDYRPNKNVGRHGRSRKKHIPLEPGEVATDSHGRLLYVLGKNGERVTHGVCMVKLAALETTGRIGWVC